ncbi:diguanylate cyclase (GGDEF) domain-containing protein with a PAS/PAC sensor [Synechococcus sp. WH 8101]|uniref:GGDEF domain-containing protein n=1 Tax=Synechococcus sp. WH 8101 TaxID=59932 RepID=UPI0010237CDC|nr:GGDEF domain-containing protein [Synechococcus sp. WH 8101]QNI45602.1 diguanylate cyclase (GGDEF) domain-containing protein with a PAS/PAC sensor [Synechococcus sp. WH 8101]
MNGATLRRLAMLGGVTLLATTIGLLGYWRSESIVRLSQERNRQALLRGLSIALVDPLIGEDLAGLESRLKQAMADPNLHGIEVRNRQGQTLAHLERPSPGAPPSTVIGAPAATEPGLIELRSTIKAGGPVGSLAMTRWSTPVEQLLLELRLQILLISLMAALVCGAAMWLVALGLQARNRQQRLVLEQENQSLQQDALVDPLTGLANRRQLEHCLEQHLSAMQRGTTPTLALCLLDLDGFKPINDVFGHEAGDHLLQEVGKRLRAGVRQSDLVARLGGDEFVLVLISTTSPQQVEGLLNRLIEQIRQPVHYRDTTVSVTASFGCTLLQPHTDRRGKAELPGVSQLLRCADQAMYQAKHHGRDNWRIVTVHSINDLTSLAAPAPAAAASSGQVGLLVPQHTVLGREQKSEQKQSGLYQNDATGR